MMKWLLAMSRLLRLGGRTYSRIMGLIGTIATIIAVIEAVSAMAGTLQAYRRRRDLTGGGPTPSVPTSVH